MECALRTCRALHSLCVVGAWQARTRVCLFVRTVRPPAIVNASAPTTNDEQEVDGQCRPRGRTVLRRAPVRGSLQPGAVACRAAAYRRGLLWCRASGLRDAMHRGAVAFACAVHGGHSAEHTMAAVR